MPDVAGLIHEAADVVSADLDRDIAFPIPEDQAVFFLGFREAVKGRPTYVLRYYSELPTDDDPVTKVIRIPESHVGFLSSMFHAASLFTAYRDRMDDQDLETLSSFREVAQSFGIAHEHAGGNR